ncbi:type III polyketide synthase [Sphingomonas piscis]|uniref:Type III polyketide synthase n=1 Tax=Sphingomonas piscis TaxID=2714943 RepID=A0A6G7YND1_9SPHN|nr:type III polyketide synthase [Sphingomonas piscis]QIK78237.1 type III polyketide synthase [Sphingomonas piscis]
MQSSNLLSVATAVPKTIITQAEAKSLAADAFGGRPALFDRLAGVFDNAGIDTRHIVAPKEWYTEHRGWAERNALYLQSAEALFIEAATKALELAGVGGEEIDGVVTVSTTGIATPSLEARVSGRMGFRSDIRRVPVFGLGCAGGVSGMATAARLAAGEPGSRWLFVTVETCSISIRLDSNDPAAVVATALFADGAAAAVVGAGEPVAKITGSAEQLWPDTLKIMGWDVEDPGLAVIFDRAIPPFIEAELRRAMGGMLQSLGIDWSDVDRLCSHPGGMKVLQAIEAALELPDGSLDVERDVLREYGNMSAPTVLFVLERLLKRGLPDRALMTAFGPGFTCAGLLLEKA